MDNTHKLNRIEMQLCDIQGRLFNLSIKRGISSEEIYKLASVKVMKQNYEKFYMMTPEEAIEILKEAN